MRAVVSAGDPSGDVRAAELLQELGRMTRAEFSGLGGTCLRNAGADVVYDLEEYSVMGFTEVISSLGRLRKLRSGMRSLILEKDPDLVLLVDYPGMNLPLADWASSRGYRVVYYISPQLWAWGRRRIGRIRRSVDLMMTLFRFEAEYYRERGVRAVWTGHPLADSIPRPMKVDLSGRVAFLPGSRKQEVSLLAGPMAGAYALLRERSAASSASVAVAPNVPAGLYSPLSERSGVDCSASVEKALEGAAAAVVCSGTATLETAMWGVPFVITYRTSPVTYLIARVLVRGVRNIGMANLVTGAEHFPELLQGGVTPSAIADAVTPLLSDSTARRRSLEASTLVRKALGRSGSSGRAAECLLRETV